jgi:hypothetical protein
MAGNDIEQLKKQQAELHHAPIGERPLQSPLTSTIPIVMAVLGDPAGGGIVPGPARPPTCPMAGKYLWHLVARYQAPRTPGTVDVALSFVLC